MLEIVHDNFDFFLDAKVNAEIITEMRFVRSCFHNYVAQISSMHSFEKTLSCKSASKLKQMFKRSIIAMHSLPASACVLAFVSSLNVLQVVR